MFTRHNIFLRLIKSDAYRYLGEMNVWRMIKLYLTTPGFNYSCKMRATKYFSEGKLSKLFFPISYLRYRRAMVRYGISIPYKTSIGYGFYIGHFGSIVVNSDCIIGDNVNISQGVTLGQAGKDGEKGSPVIGDNVYIAPNSTIVGNIVIGSDVAIGANAFVNKNIPSGITVGGVPAKSISDKGSKDYIHNKFIREEILK